MIGKILGRALGPLGVGLDYYEGRRQGEDRVRAAAGSTGAGLGGWGGATVGAAVGTSILPGPGTAIGGIAGGIAGSLGGGWGADRIDEAIRGSGKQKPKTQEEKNKSVQYGVASSYLGQDILKNSGEKSMAGLGAARPVARAVYETGKIARGLMPWIVGGAGVAGAYGVNKLTGNPIGKGVDTITGQATNFAEDELDYLYQNQPEYNPYENMAYEDQLVGGRAWKTARENAEWQLEQAKLVQELGFERALEKMAREQANEQKLTFAQLESQDAINRLQALDNARARANDAVQTIVSARY
jgi:hypothetical protein